MIKFQPLLRQYWPTVVLFALLLASWQLAVSYGGLREYLLPAPLSVWNALWHGDTAWEQHLWVTSLEIVGAFAMAAGVGVALGVAIAWSPLIANALVPFLVINTAVGLSQVEADMLDLGRVFNAPKWKIFLKIRLPNALPYILSSLKITATAAVVGAIVGEFVASQKGLGYVIVATQSSMNTAVAFAALIWISVVGLVLYGAVVLAAKAWAPWAEGID